MIPELIINQVVLNNAHSLSSYIYIYTDKHPVTINPTQVTQLCVVEKLSDFIQISYKSHENHHGHGWNQPFPMVFPMVFPIASSQDIAKRAKRAKPQSQRRVVLKVTALLNGYFMGISSQNPPDFQGWCDINSCNIAGARLISEWMEK